MKIINKYTLTFIFVILSLSSIHAQQLLRIMPLGNSITEGIHGSVPIGGYRDDLYSLLTDASFDFDFVGTKTDGDGGVFDVDHQGTSGIRADELLAGLNAWLNATFPNVVLLHIGTNDISQGQTVNSTLNEIEQIVDLLYAFNNDIKILLASITPRSDFRANLTQQLNQDIANLVPQKSGEGIDIFYVPINEAFLANANWASQYLDDAVHPNNSGYNVMAIEWFNSINSNLSNNGASTIQIVSGNNQNGGVGEVLGVPLKIKVVDVNQNPVNNVTVRFNPISGFGFLLPNLSDYFRILEAEASTIFAPMQIGTDNGASGGEYVSSSVKFLGKLSFTFEVTQEDDYYLWARVFSPSILEDSFFFTMSGSVDTFLLDTDDQHGEWYWKQFEDRNQGRITYHLTPGTYEFHVITREDNSRLDKILITDNSDYIPQGIAGYSDQSTNSLGEALAYWQLGSLIGQQQVEVTSPNLPGQSVIFSATATPPDTQTISIAGDFKYFSNDQPILDIQVTLNNASAAVSDINGDFNFSGLQSGGNYTVTPDSQGIVQAENNTIISFDAALVARHAVGLDTLDANPAIAADANNDGSIVMFDAALIARYAVGLAPLSASRVGEWVFLPNQIVYNGQQASVTDANFVGILRGDVHGGWTPPQNLNKSVAANLLNQSSKIVGNKLFINIPLSSDEPIYSFDLELIHNPNEYKLIRVDLNKVENDFIVNSNRKNSSLKIGGYSVNGLENDYQIEFEYEFIDRASPGPIHLRGFRTNNTMAKSSEFQPDGMGAPNVPITFEVLPSYPNPFKDFTQLSFFLPEASNVGIKLYNILGQEVWQMTKQYESPGFHTLKIGENFLGMGLTSGIYFLSVQQNNNQAFIQKLRLIK